MIDQDFSLEHIHKATAPSTMTLLHSQMCETAKLRNKYLGGLSWIPVCNSKSIYAKDAESAAASHGKPP